jgi:23S rRNA pseudouridine1911/1915/1917 synthase
MDIENTKIGDLVLVKNNQFIALHKPAGIPVQPDKSEEISLFQLAEIYCKHPLQLVHRLDRPTSGVVVFAKNKRAAAHLSEQFREGRVAKTYWAVVKDLPNGQPEGTLTHYLVHNAHTGKSELGTAEMPQAQAADLKYRLLASSDTYHLLEIRPSTGRFHQIRAQLAAAGAPIKGDVKYGARRGNKDRSIHLHAHTIELAHPVSGVRVAIEAHAPNDEDALWRALFELINK